MKVGPSLDLTFDFSTHLSNSNQVSFTLLLSDMTASTAKKPSGKSSTKTAAAKGHNATHPSWVDMIKVRAEYLKLSLDDVYLPLACHRSVSSHTPMMLVPGYHGPSSRRLSRLFSHVLVSLVYSSSICYRSSFKKNTRSK